MWNLIKWMFCMEMGMDHFQEGGKLRWPWKHLLQSSTRFQEQFRFVASIVERIITYWDIWWKMRIDQKWAGCYVGRLPIQSFRPILWFKLASNWFNPILTSIFRIDSFSIKINAIFVQKILCFSNGKGNIKSKDSLIYIFQRYFLKFERNI